MFVVVCVGAGVVAYEVTEEGVVAPCCALLGVLENGDEATERGEGVGVEIVLVAMDAFVGGDGIVGAVGAEEV
jgi:hypothetical protein